MLPPDHHVEVFAKKDQVKRKIKTLSFYSIFQYLIFHESLSFFVTKVECFVFDTFLSRMRSAREKDDFARRNHFFKESEV